MPKTLTQFVCKECGEVASKWSGRCAFCGSWNSLAEQTAKKISRNMATIEPAAISDFNIDAQARMHSGTTELDEVLGGGIVPGSLMLLAGDPGVGKSTLVLQVAEQIARKNKVLYISAEESPSQLKMRADRLGMAEVQLDIITETDAEAIAQLIERSDYQLVVIDSIQMLSSYTVSGNPGSISQISVCAQVLQKAAKAKHCATVFIGHVTKDGQIAGPKILEHLVDVVLQMEGERFGHFRIVRASKNRFGPVGESAIYEMQSEGLVAVKNPSEALLAERQIAPGSAVFVAMEGNRPILVEVQALVSPTVFGYPKRTAVGFDLNRLNLLAAVLSRRAGVNLGNSDIYVNIVGGLKISEPAADLAIILAIASAYKNQSLPDDLAVFGEVGLSGEIRSVAGSPARLKEASKMGFKQVAAPRTVRSAEAINASTAEQIIRTILKSQS